MAEYLGDAETVARQKRLRARAAAGLPRHFASGGRTLLYVEPADETWAEALALAEADQLLALPNMPRAEIDAHVARRFDDRWSPHFWDALDGEDRAVLAASRAVMEGTPLPDGCTVEGAAHLAPHEIEEFQSLNAACGVSSNPAYMMRGEVCAAFSSLIRDGEGRLMACAWLGLFFHPESRLGGTAFAGLVSVAPEARGRGLGKLVNAHVLLDSHPVVGWRRVTEYVAADNLASRAMVLACGLTHDGTLATCVLTHGGKHFTR